MARLRLSPLLFGVALSGLVILANVLSGRLAGIPSKRDILAGELHSADCRPFCTSTSANDDEIGRIAVDLQTQDIAYQRRLGTVTIFNDEEDWADEGEEGLKMQTAAGMLKIFAERLKIEDAEGLFMKTTPRPPIDKNSILKAENQNN
ncbi:hypothetical protein CAPTEDRAFT_201823 [Capitella teleta]|uniref:Uncharacterized protein n=1 Tax=Capitella teleta TaxID=283909 RepID=R7UCP8_CAPTE|nr:hypothetical protein CAPTEDRAFT_201823 [Capitella teleta]|eukprot:ELU01563.1 hypothetical protein CAPTEDRAFT_201823 [Capitella teleta]